MQRAAFDPNWTSAETAEKLAVSALAAKEAADKPVGIPPELLDRCLRLKARPKGHDAPKSADDLVLVDQETKKAREQCVRSVVAKHRQQQKKAAAAKK